MAQRRRRHVRRDVLVFLGSFVAHALVFTIVARELTISYRLPAPPEPAIETEIVPPEPTIPIIPPPPIEVRKPEPTPPKPVPEPKPQPQPQPQPQPVAPAPSPEQPAPKVSVTRTAPARTAANPTLVPAPKAALVPTPLAPSIAAPQPGPPAEVPHAPVSASQPHVITAAPSLRLHQSKAKNASPLAPPVSIPGSSFGTPQASPGQTAGGPGAPGGAPGAPGGTGGAGGFPNGALPGFGGGLRGSLLGCINAQAAHLTPEEQARCAERLGSGAKVAPVMDPIGASARGALNDEAARQAAANRYRDATPPGPASVIPGQPHLGHSPTEEGQ